MKRLFLMAMLIICSTMVFGLGIMPAKTTVSMFPYQGSFKVVNTESSSIHVILSVDGDSVVLDANALTIPANGRGVVYFTVHESSRQVQKISVKQKPKDGAMLNFALLLHHSVIIPSNDPAPAVLPGDAGAGGGGNYEVVPPPVYPDNAGVDAKTPDGVNPHEGILAIQLPETRKTLMKKFNMARSNDLAIAIGVNALLAFGMITLLLRKWKQV